MVFQSMCVFVLWSQCCVMCCFHMFYLCFWINVSMFLLRSCSWGSLWFCSLILFLFSIVFLMCCGRSLWFLWIFPFGMLCLSAVNINLVNMLFAVCVFVGGCMSSSACVNLSKLA